AARANATGTDKQTPAQAGSNALSERQPGGTSRIRGRVVRDPQGLPVADAEVVLLLPPPKGQNVYIGDLPLRTTRADASGAFVFEGLAAGLYRIWANRGNLTSRKERARGDAVVVPESVESPTPVDLKLAEGVTLATRVRDAATGKPIAGATIHLGWSDFP